MNEIILNRTEISPAEAGLDVAVLERLSASAQADIDAGLHFGAALLVARGGKIAYRANLGTVAPGRPAADGDRYCLMSMSKTYTAALVLRAIEEGRFTFDTRVGDILPGFGRRGKENATVYQLLNHTAGLPTALIPPPLPLTAFNDLAGRVEAICMLPAVYRPGTRCAYTSGIGYDVLGQILVKTDQKGRPFHVIAKEDLFEPLGMQHSSFGIATDDPLRVPASFTPSAEAPTSSLMCHIFNDLVGPETDYPAGCAFGDIDDVFKFTEALLGRTKGSFQLLSSAMFAKARQNTTGDFILETILSNRLLVLRQMINTFGFPGLIKILKAARTGRANTANTPRYPANFTLLGGYVRGTGEYLNPAGRTASPTTISAMGGASTGWLVDTERDLTFIFLSAGFVEGFAHPMRLERLADIAIASVIK